MESGCDGTSDSPRACTDRSLRTIVNSLTTAILPVLNAMMVLAIVTSVYAVMAVILFKDSGALGQANFGRFSMSLFTMFQVCTG